MHLLHTFEYNAKCHAIHLFYILRIQTRRLPYPKDTKQWCFHRETYHPGKTQGRKHLKDSCTVSASIPANVNKSVHASPSP